MPTHLGFSRTPRTRGRGDVATAALHAGPPERYATRSTRPSSGHAIVTDACSDNDRSASVLASRYISRDGPKVGID